MRGALDPSYDVYFGVADRRNVSDLSLEAACLYAASCILPGEVAEIVSDDIIVKVCRRGEIGPPFLTDVLVDG